MEELNTKINGIIEVLEEIKEDHSTPKKVKEKLDKVINELSTNKETTVAAHNAIYELEGMGENANMEAYTRTQILHIVSILESI